MTKLYEDYQHQSKYARYLDEKKRRESWDESCQRFVNFWRNDIDGETSHLIYDAINKKEVMPSMRAFMTAGEALERDHVAGYNCAYTPVDHPRVFDETLYILCCGTGVGFSVEQQHVNKLPEVSEEFYDTDSIITVADSKIGWAKAFKELIAMLYSGQVPKWDVSKVRAKGERLKTFGGRASGAEPLVELFRFAVYTFKRAAGRKLTSLECHDLMCKIGDIVVVGGVRRSAMISLSDLSDSEMQKAKYGQWWESNPQRALANNSVAYSKKPSMSEFMDEWRHLYISKSGERGIFNREACYKFAPERRETEGWVFGTNPCSEIVLRPNQFCNLTEVIVRRTDTLEDLKRKVEIATIIGTLQATLTNFRYLRQKWKDNTNEERLLGVSLTGICDHKTLADVNNPYLASWLEDLKYVAIQVNEEWAARLGIPASSAITCVKPSGTVSQLCDTSSGIHPRYNDYYYRRVRQDNKDPLTQYMKDAGIPWEDCAMKPGQTTVFTFPIKAPAGSITRNDMSAIDQLEHWLVYQKHWCEHKPSITVYVREHEWLEVGAWVYEHFDAMSGVSFLPYDSGSYVQAPYEDITKEVYEEAVRKMPKTIDWSALVEDTDFTTSSQTLACVGGACEL